MQSIGSGDAAAKIFRDWSEIAYGEAAMALLAALLLVAALRFAIPRLTRWLPDRLHVYVLPWEPILRLTVLLGAALYVANLFVEPTPQNLLSIAGALAVALGFAFKDYASSLLAGVVALYERPYRAGDWVEIDGSYGEVQSLGLRTVQILTPDDTLIAVPHGRMWSSLIHNANSGMRDLMCVADFHLHPDHDGRLVREALRDVALTSPYLNLERPVAVVASEEPWGTRYRLKAYPIEARDQFQFVTDLTLRGKRLLQRHGIRPAAAAAAAPLGR